MAIPLIVVGLGARGREWCAEIARAAAFEVVAACDPSEAARTRAIADGLASDRILGSLDAALRATSAAAAIVATPLDDHVRPCAAALDAGLAVLVEKPFTLNVADAQRLVRLARDRGVPLLVGQNQRYLRYARATKDVLDRGLLGRLALVSFSAYREGHALVAGVDRVRGSALWELGIHHLDLLRYLVARPVTAVTAVATTPPWVAPLRDTTWNVTLEFDGGPMAAYQLTWDSRGHGAFEGGRQLIARIVGERGTLHVLQRWLVLCLEGHRPRVLRRGPRPVTEEQLVLGEFAAAVLDGHPTALAAADNVHTVALAEACVRSARTGLRVVPAQLLSECP